MKFVFFFGEVESKKSNKQKKLSFKITDMVALE